MNSFQLDKLAKRLGFRGRNRSLLDVARTHSSWVNENPDESYSDNENMEFLGDAVLDLVVSHYLYSRLPDLSPGEYTRLRASVVNRAVLAHKAREIELGAYIRLGRGEERSSGRDKDSVLADTLEAVIGARFLAAGYHAAEKLVLGLFDSELEQVCRNGSEADYKSMLQNYTQDKFKEIPRYQVVTSSGPDHDPRFEVEVLVHSEVFGRGTGKSKKVAEQEAARVACMRVAEQAESGKVLPDE